MASKTITISEEAYNELRKLKSGGESFSKVILKLIRLKKQGIGPLLNFIETTRKRTPDLIVDLAESTEKVVDERKNAKWRVTDFELST